MMKSITKSIFVLFLIIILLLPLFSCTKSESSFKITFIDVGQGDSALVSCDGHHMLIDAGCDDNSGDIIADILKKNNVSYLDILVASHMDEDHIGGFSKVLMNISRVDLALSNTDNGSTKVFERFKNGLFNMGVEITIPILGAEYYLGEAKIKIIDNSCLHKNDSLVLLITYKNTSFLFTGDMEYSQEHQIISRNGIKTQNDLLIKVAHHGANTSTSKDLVELIRPKYAIISVGENNQYGHPHTETLNILKKYNVKVYRTDQYGNIEIVSDGKKIKKVS